MISMILGLGVIKYDSQLYFISFSQSFFKILTEKLKRSEQLYQFIVAKSFPISARINN